MGVMETVELTEQEFRTCMGWDFSELVVCLSAPNVRALQTYARAPQIQALCGKILVCKGFTFYCQMVPGSAVLEFKLV